MKKILAAVALLAIASSARAQEGLIVGMGNFFSPIVGDLDKAIAFYRDGIGLDVQGAPANADQNPALRNMFGLPDAQLRWIVGRPPAMRTPRETASATWGAVLWQGLKSEAVDSTPTIGQSSASSV